MRARHGIALFVLAVFVLSAPREVYGVGKTSLVLSRDSIIHIVTQIQRADYEGDRPSLKRLHDELTPIPEDNRLASRVLYWRGFALWRRAINGFNESPTPNDLEEDLAQSVTDCRPAAAANLGKFLSVALKTLRLYHSRRVSWTPLGWVMVG